MSAPVRKLSAKTIDTVEAAEELVAYYLQQDAFAFDVETTDPHRGNPVVAPVTWLSMATHGRADVIPLGHPHGELVKPAHSFREKFYDPNVLTAKTKKPKTQYRTVQVPAVWTPAPKQLRHSEWWPIAKPLFMDPNIYKVAHNALFDLLAVTKYLGEKPSPPYDDTMGMAHLIDENARKGLKELVSVGNRVPTTTFRHFPGYGHKYDHENVGKCVEKHPFRTVARYALLDAKYCWWLWEDLSYILGHPDLSRVMDVYEMEMDLYPALLDMMLRGACVDETRLRELSEEFSPLIHDAEKAVYVEAGKVFDLGSPLQMSQVLYEERGNKVEIKSKKTGNPSTSQAALDIMDDPIVPLIETFREFQKLTSTYVGTVDEEGEHTGGLANHLHEGRIHTSLKPFGTVTGRFSSGQPNLQNIPSRGKSGKLIRSVFIPEHEDRLLVVADYSQIEYRVLAHMCHDPTLIRAFEEGYDPHAAVAAQLLDKLMEDVTDEERSLGKTFNFAQIYGAGDENLSNQLGGVSHKRVKQFRRQYEEQFPLVGKFCRYVVKEARSHRPVPYTETLLGRRRYLPALLWSNDTLRNKAERQAVNSKVQGSAADIIKVAMLRVAEGLADYPDWWMLLTVHDELILSAPREEAEDCAKFLTTTMEAVDMIDVPLEAESSIGPTWADAKG